MAMTKSLFKLDINAMGALLTNKICYKLRRSKFSLTMHYAKVVMGRRKFKFTAIQGRISLSLSNLFSFASKSLCKPQENEQKSFKNIVAFIKMGF